MQSDDTIVALSSTIGPALRAIVRFSGADAVRIANQLLTNPLADADRSRAIHSHLTVADVTLSSIAYVFRAPHSATGEDVVELHVSGNPILIRWVLDAALALGARAAEPGEFTARAYFNRRVDLVQAEGIAAAISATNEADLDAARRLMSGALAEQIKSIIDGLAQSLALLEVSIDFSEEEVTFIDRDALSSRLSNARRSLQALRGGAARSERLSHEPLIVFAGRPNAGKSTLLNALAGEARAVVSPIAGTTRDAVAITVPLARGIVRMIDTAGLEVDIPLRVNKTAVGSIERQMRSVALKWVSEADILVLVSDLSDTRAEFELSRQPNLIIRTKSDLVRGRLHSEQPNEMVVAAIDGTGIAELRDRFDAIAFGSPAAPFESLAEDGSASREVMLNARHLIAIDEAITAISDALDSLDAGAEIVAWQLRAAVDALGTISGSVSTDDVLGRIFSTFCIGK